MNAQIQRHLRFRDKGTDYDNEGFDNVYNSARLVKTEGVAQTDIVAAQTLNRSPTMKNMKRTAFLDGFRDLETDNVFVQKDSFVKDKKLPSGFVYVPQNNIPFYGQQQVKLTRRQLKKIEKKDLKDEAVCVSDNTDNSVVAVEVQS